jgi:hypothetical protein
MKEAHKSDSWSLGTAVFYAVRERRVSMEISFHGNIFYAVHERKFPCLFWQTVPGLVLYEPIMSDHDAIERMMSRASLLWCTCSTKAPFGRGVPCLPHTL